MSQRGGRPPGPTAETTEQVLQTAFRLLGTEGPASLTPVRIHQESGVARTTIYRNWPTPAHIVEAILSRAVARDEIDKLTGDFEHDLRVAVDSVVFRLGNRPVRLFYDALRLHGDQDESPSISERYIHGLTAPVRDVLTSAIDRGSLDAASDAEALTSQICGPLLFDHMLLGRPVEAGTTEQAIERFFAVLP